MSQYEGITEGDFGKSTKKRLPICFCLDVSGSMVSPMPNGGTRIGELNRAYDRFITTMKSNPEVAKSADIAIVTFGGKVSILKGFDSLERQKFTEIKVNQRSFTPMGDGIQTALRLLDVRKNAYKQRGIKYFQPWLVVLTDGEPEGPNAIENFNLAVQQVYERESNNKLVVFNIAIGSDCNFEKLKMLSCRNAEPIYVNQSSDFNEFFKFLGSSSSSIISGASTEADIISQNGSLPKGKELDINQFL